MKRIPFMRLKRKLRALRTSQHVRKGYRLAAIEKAQQIMREIKEERR